MSYVSKVEEFALGAEWFNSSKVKCLGRRESLPVRSGYGEGWGRG